MITEEEAAKIDRNEIGKNLSEDEEIYKENIIDHYKYPHNKGEIKFTIKHQELNPVCGDEITIYIRIKDRKIEDVSFTGHGCAISQASISMLTDKIKGMKIDKVNDLTKEDVLEMLGIPISYVRMKCALLSLKVVQEGLENVRN